MNVDSLAAELLGLSYDARIRRLVEVGRQSRSEPEVAALLTRWEHGDWQQQQWALFACYGSLDGQRPARLATSPSRSLANLAISLLAQLGDDAQVVRVLHALPTIRRNRLLSNLRRRRRAAPINTFIAQLRADSNRQGFLYHALATDQPTVADGSAPLDVTSWKRRARSRPEETAEELIRALRALDQRPDGLLFQASQAALEVLAETRPELGLKILQHLHGHLPLGRLPCDLMIKRCPREMADLVLAETSPVTFDFSRVVRQLDLDRLLALLEKQPGTFPYPWQWYKDLDPASREAVYRRFGVNWRDQEECLPADLVGMLPGAMRQTEARRHLELPILHTRPLARAVYCAFLPWPEARSQLRNYFQHPEAEMRAAAWQALTRAARYHPANLTELLALVRERKYEQDPVRLAFLNGLADLPPRRWTEAHLPELVGVIREALDAADLSPASTNALARLLWRLLPVRPEWSAEQLALVFRERGAVFSLALESRLTDDDARRVEEALVPVYSTWKETNREGWLYWVACCLGCRLRVCSYLLRFLRDLPALGLLRLYLPRPDFEALLIELLGRDAGWITDSIVFRHLYFHRQDLLQGFLHQTYLPTRGSLHRRDLIYLLPVGGEYRLTATQQRILGQTLVGITALPPGKELPRDAWAILLAIQRLSRLPAMDQARLVELAGEERLVVRDAALRGLGRLDAGQGIATLVEALDDDRARVAIYALRMGLANLPVERVLAILKAAPLRKVTVAKETLRLAGEFGGDAAFPWLEELARQDLHRDVRIALLRALWDHLERPAAWVMLNEAAQAPDARLLNGVVRIPADKLSVTARGRLIDLLSGLVQRPEPTVRLVVLQRFAQMPVPDPGRVLLERSVRLLASNLPDERAAAGAAIVALAIPEDASRLSAALRELLPLRRPLVEWLNVFTPNVPWNLHRLEGIARAMLAVVQSDPLLLNWEAALAVALDGFSGLRSVLERVQTSGGLHSDAMMTMERTIAGLGQRPDWNNLEQLEAVLAASSDERLRRLAITALSEAARRHEWTASRRVRLQQYRTDASPLVAGAAQMLFLPGE